MNASERQAGGRLCGKYSEWLETSRPETGGGVDKAPGVAGSLKGLRWDQFRSINLSATLQKIRGFLDFRCSACSSAINVDTDAGGRK